MGVNTSGYLLWLADAARAGGLNVEEVPGWQTRGHGNYTECRGVVCHHTGNPSPGNYPSLKAVRDGRSDLAGPLAGYGLGRDGTVYVIAAGVAWHAGAGVYPKPPASPWLPTDMGNWFSVGIEAESAGTVDDWTPAQRDAYPRLAAAICRALGVGSDRVIGHKEYSSAGKPDPAFWDMNAFRAAVAAILEGNDMDPSTKISFSDGLGAYFDRTGGEGFGDRMRAEFPRPTADGQQGTAPFGVVESWGAMSARAAYFKATETDQKVDALRTDVDAKLAALTALVQQLVDR